MSHWIKLNPSGHRLARQEHFRNRTRPQQPWRPRRAITRLMQCSGPKSGANHNSLTTFAAIGFLDPERGFHDATAGTGGAWAGDLAPPAACARQRMIPMIGYLDPQSFEGAAGQLRAFRQDIRAGRVQAPQIRQAEAAFDHVAPRERCGAMMRLKKSPARHLNHYVSELEPNQGRDRYEPDAPVEYDHSATPSSVGRLVFARSIEIEWLAH